MEHETIGDLIADMSFRDGRAAAFTRLARSLGATDMLVLVPDPQTGRARPVLGATQTLPGTSRWRAFIRACRSPGEREAEVEAPRGGYDVRVRGLTTQDGDIFVLIDPGPSCALDPATPPIRLALSLFRAELVADLALVSAGVAQDITLQSERLLASLEITRGQVAQKAEALAAALAEAGRANAALHLANQRLDAQRLVAERAANVDALTGVASRALIESSLASAIAGRTDSGDPLSLLLIDLDGFKEINDTRGHAAGDAILVAIGERLMAVCAGRGMLAGRLGGDEFALILEGRTPGAAAIEAERIQALIRVSVPFGTEELPARCTMGLASFPQDAITPTDLLRKADLALYGAKKSNKGALGRYSQEVEFLFDGRRQAVSLLRDALEAHRVVAHYQPKVSLLSGQVVGFEALVRLVDHDGRLRGPADFWAAFSDQESVRLLGGRMLDLVLGDIAGCRAAGLTLYPVAINVSGPEMSNPNFGETVLAKVQAANVSTTQIQMEVTETALLGDHPAKLKASLVTLRAAGISVALDDFGTGYSSLSYLLDWDVDCIKIDRSFIGGLGQSARSTNIVRCIVDLARGLQLDVVAEGVETAEQAAFLRSIGCRHAQGYLFGRAVPPEDSIRSPQPNYQVTSLIEPPRSWSKILHGVAGEMAVWTA